MTELDFVGPESAAIGVTPTDGSSNVTSCGMLDDKLGQPMDSYLYFLLPDGRRTKGEEIEQFDIGTKAVYECTDSKLKSAFRECQVGGGWSHQNRDISCDKWRYWAAVIVAAASAFVILLLLIYFICSAYYKRKKRKYISRAERLRNQDETMMRNEDFVRQNFRQLPLNTPHTINTLESTIEVTEETPTAPGADTLERNDVPT